ncbi:MAG: hypothetical protein A4E57_03120 [Syntrophorhabdaceae bacterium PtaU1.Bin034]|nr:MAG: hypothetical protein A4E57_03120 [Syntrophorhabdaceae bacterium PtaU1.Bin034]
MLFLYLDESGDLGFDFVSKKPSKYFVVTVLAVHGHDDNRQIINGVKKTIRRKLNPSGKQHRIVQELKGTGTTPQIKQYFYDQVRDIDFKIYSIILNKKRVFGYLANNKARVYNFVSRLLLEKIPLEQATTKVDLIIDRSKGKPEILNFNKYIQSQLEARIQPTIPFDINHLDSCNNCGLQAVDMFSYGVFQGYERRKWEWFNIFKEKVAFYTVYLP